MLIKNTASWILLMQESIVGLWAGILTSQFCRMHNQTSDLWWHSLFQFPFDQKNPWMNNSEIANPLLTNFKINADYQKSFINIFRDKFLQQLESSFSTWDVSMRFITQMLFAKSYLTFPLFPTITNPILILLIKTGC